MSASADTDPRQVIDPSRALVPATVQLNEQRVRRGFLPKLRRVASRIPFADQALSVWFSARDPATPAASKGLMLAGLAYFVLPTDAIPDILAGVGFTDDAAVLLALMGLVGNHVKPRHKDAAREVVERVRDDRG